FTVVVLDPAGDFLAVDADDVLFRREAFGEFDDRPMLFKLTRGGNAEFEHAGGVDATLDRFEFGLLGLGNNDLDLVVAELLDRDFLRAGQINALHEGLDEGGHRIAAVQPGEALLLGFGILFVFGDLFSPFLGELFVLGGGVLFVDRRLVFLSRGDVGVVLAFD